MKKLVTLLIALAALASFALAETSLLQRYVFEDCTIQVGKDIEPGEWTISCYEEIGYAFAGIQVGSEFDEDMGQVSLFSEDAQYLTVRNPLYVRDEKSNDSISGKIIPLTSTYYFPEGKYISVVFGKMVFTRTVASSLGSSTTHNDTADQRSLEDLGHWEEEGCTLIVHVDFTKNAFFSTYDVDVFLNGELQATMKHGEDHDLEFTVQPGEIKLTFARKGDGDVNGEVTIHVFDDTVSSMKITCTGSLIDITNFAADMTESAFQNLVQTSDALEIAKVSAMMDVGSSVHSFVDAYYLEDVLAVDFDMGTRYYYDNRVTRTSVASMVLRLSKILFENTDIKEFRAAYNADLRDADTGSLDSLRVMSIRISRNTFEKLDYEWMIDRVKTYPDDFFEGADFHSLHYLFRD